MKQLKSVQIIDESQDEMFTWKDIKTILEKNKVVLEDDDIVDIGYVEGHYSENNSWYAYNSFKVIRKILETDEQYNKRLEENRIFTEERKKERYKNYLKLKQEFETNEN